jgi:hypothetical protein
MGRGRTAPAGAVGQRPKEAQAGADQGPAEACFPVADESETGRPGGPGGAEPAVPLGLRAQVGPVDPGQILVQKRR